MQIELAHKFLLFSAINGYGTPFACDHVRLRIHGGRLVGLRLSHDGVRSCCCRYMLLLVVMYLV